MSVLWDGTILWIYYCKSQQEVMTLSSCDSQSCGNMTFKLYTIDMVAQTGVDIGVTENQDARQDNKPLVAKKSMKSEVAFFQAIWLVKRAFLFHPSWKTLMLFSWKGIRRGFGRSMVFLLRVPMLSLMVGFFLIKVGVFFPLLILISSGWWQLKHLWFLPRKLGKMNPFWPAYFSKWVGSNTNSSFLGFVGA